MTTITTILGTDTLTDSRSVINTNFSNLNTAKVEGPASATDNAITRFDSTSGKLIQNSLATIDDSGNITATNLSGTNSGDNAVNTTYDTKVKNLMSSALISGPAVMTIGTPTSKFNVPAFTAQFIDNWTNPLVPVLTTLNYAGSTNNTITNLATQDATYISFDKNGTMYQSSAFISGAELRDKVQIGALVHQNRTSISNISSYTANLSVDISAGISDLSMAIGFVNSGNKFSANGANLKVNKSSGNTTYIGINSVNGSHSPNKTIDSALTAPVMLQTWRNGAGGWITNLSDTIVPGKYDNDTAGGTTSPNGNLTTNKWQLIKVYFSPELALTGLEYGQVVYNSLAEAEASRSIDTVPNPLFNGTSFRGWIITRGGATNLSLSGDALFSDSGKFGTVGGVGSGSSTTTLQQAYDNSSNPEILTDTTRGSLSIKRGTGADTDVILDGQNGAGTVTSSITGAGVITATSFVGPLGNGTTAGLSLNDYTTAEKTKLSGIDTGATANSSDATLLARANHTGTQLASTISDFTSAVNALITGKQDTSAKDTTGGYVGLTLFKINFKNVANTFTSFFTNSNTASRTYTFKDADGTIAFTSDITGTNSGTNTGDVTLAGTPNYITIAGQVITRALVNLTSHVTGRLPFANLVAPTTTSILLGRGTTAGDTQEITLGTNLSMSGTTLNATGGGASTLDGLTDVTIATPVNGQALVYNSVSSQWENTTAVGSGDVVGPASAVTNRIATFNGTTGKLIQDGGSLISDLVAITGNQTIGGTKTFSSDILVPDEVYGVGWNGSLEAPTKNAVYDKIQTLGSGGTSLGVVYAMSRGIF